MAYTAASLGPVYGNSPGSPIPDAPESVVGGDSLAAGTVVLVASVVVDSVVDGASLVDGGASLVDGGSVVDGAAVVGASRLTVVVGFSTSSPVTVSHAPAKKMSATNAMAPHRDGEVPFGRSRVRSTGRSCTPLASRAAAAPA